MLKFKKYCKKLILVAMSVVLLSGSLGSDYLSASCVYAAPTASFAIEDAIFQILLGIGSTVLLTSGTSLDLGSDYSYSEHDVARFGYDYLVSHGYDASLVSTYDALCSVFYFDTDWKTATLDPDSPVDFQEILKRQQSQSIGIAFKDSASSLWDTITDFVASVCDGSNTLAVGDHTLSATDIAYTGVDPSIKNADGSKNLNVRVSYKYAFNGNIIVGQKKCEKQVSDIEEKGIYYRSYLLKNGNYADGYFGYYSDGNYFVNFLDFEYKETYENGSYYSSGKGGSTAFTFSMDSYSCNIPIFNDLTSAKNYLKTGDDSACINKEASKLSVNDVFQYTKGLPLLALGTASVLAGGLYDSLVKVKDDIASGVITDAKNYSDTVASSISDVASKGLTGAVVSPTVAPSSVPKPTSVPLPSESTDILDWVKSIAASISEFPLIRDEVTAIGDVFPALRDDVKTIGDIFPQIREDIASIASGFPAIRDNITAIGDIFPALSDNVALIGDIFPLAQSIEDLMKTKILPKITEDSLTLSTLGQTVDGTISDSLADIRSSALSIPDVLTDIRDKVGAISIPDSISLADVKELLLSLPDYTSLLQLIIELLKQILQAIKDILAFLKDFFILDPAVVKDYAIARVHDIPAFDGFLPVVGYIDQLKGAFSDFYDYPKITMQTPDILVPYVGEQILLIDFQDYAKYFLWVRTFLAFSISFGFVLWVVKQFKVVYTVN